MGLLRKKPPKKPEYVRTDEMAAGNDGDLVEDELEDSNEPEDEIDKRIRVLQEKVDQLAANQNQQQVPEVSPQQMRRSIAEQPEIQKKPQKRTIVVDELPTQPIRKYIDDQGMEINLITRDEALAILLSR